MIAGEHAEAARIDRQRLMERELGGEIRDRAGTDLREVAFDPGVVRAARSVETRNRTVVVGDPLGIADRALDRLESDKLKHPHRVVRCQPPQRIVEASKHIPRIAVPAPPQVVRQFMQTRDAIGQMNHRGAIRAEIVACGT